MKEPRVDIWCDWCWAEHEGARVPGATSEVRTVPGLKPRRIDECEVHAKGVSVLRDLLREKGAEPTEAELIAARKPRKPEEVATLRPTPAALPSGGSSTAGQKQGCPVCGEPMHRASIAAHLYAVHNKHDRPEFSQPDTCPDCGGKFDRLAQHRTRQHGYDRLADMVDYYIATRARKAG